MNNINLSSFSVLGISYRRSIYPSNLKNLIYGFQNELGIEFSSFELAVVTIDTETAEKYGLSRDLELSKLIYSQSDRIVNFYYEFYQDYIQSYVDMVKYLSKTNSIMIYLDEPDPEIYPTQAQLLDKYNIPKIQYKL